jgi:hypothetical protein
MRFPKRSEQPGATSPRSSARGGQVSSALANSVPNGRYETFRTYMHKIQIVREVVQSARYGVLSLRLGRPLSDWFADFGMR